MNELELQTDPPSLPHPLENNEPSRWRDGGRRIKKEKMAAHPIAVASISLRLRLERVS